MIPVHAVLLSVEQQKIQKHKKTAPLLCFGRRACGFFRWFLEVVLFTISSTACVKRAIRGLGVPFVGNDKNKASNSHHNPLSLSLLSLSSEGGRRKRRVMIQPTGGRKETKDAREKGFLLALLLFFSFLLTQHQNFLRT